MQQEAEFQLSPAWKHALRELTSRGLNPGDVITKAELVVLFRLEQPTTAQEQEQFQLDFMRQFMSLRDELLQEHRVALRTMRGERAYEVVAPQDQTDHAMREGLKEMSRANRKMARTLVYVKHDQLNDAQRKHNADSIAKTAMLAGMIRTPRLPAK